MHLAAKRLGPFTVEACGEHGDKGQHVLHEFLSGVGRHGSVQHLDANTVGSEGLDDLDETETRQAVLELHQYHIDLVRRGHLKQAVQSSALRFSFNPDARSVTVATSL